MVSFDSLRRIYYFIFNVGLIAFTYYLHETNILSYNQSYLLYFGAFGAFFVVDFLIYPKTTLFKEHQIFVMLPLVLGIALLTCVLIASSINSNLSVIILVAVDLLIAGTLGIMDWTNKRKQKQTSSQKTPLPF